MDTERPQERERSVLLDWNPTGGLGYHKDHHLTDDVRLGTGEAFPPPVAKSKKAKRLAGFKYQSVAETERYIPGAGHKAVKTVRGKVQEVLGNVDAAEEDKVGWRHKIKEEASLEVEGVDSPYRLLLIGSGVSEGPKKVVESTVRMHSAYVPRHLRPGYVGILSPDAPSSPSPGSPRERSPQGSRSHLSRKFTRQNSNESVDQGFKLTSSLTQKADTVASAFHGRGMVPQQHLDQLFSQQVKKMAPKTVPEAGTYLRRQAFRTLFAPQHPCDLRYHSTAQ
mmetsp:Transcript_69161/g.164945  ORF Transcript_69161/g.164945 Transcript_69161/m.164945 type:complete len:280 (+) Transcript_69161:179-1018(+)|eukprot:CAMPEP_0180144198 /NCGR_PEP_ID=MMETSP0986-20121125/16741_1 /TAXON_ID=697907 /ORGANISM="non described non described, Strain CCMP2293" /LENGTH=279 /DNA_ID=CAMNT_0022087957 /DNA_START=179 /DNA_END=1018 /DNA_ORIENTATION=+